MPPVDPMHLSQPICNTQSLLFTITILLGARLWAGASDCGSDCVLYSGFETFLGWMGLPTG